jgi:hypothetical protein
MSDLPKLTVERFTVSYSLDTMRNGVKSSHFVSMGFLPERPVTLAEAAILQIEACDTVTIAAIHDAVARGAISTDDANDFITNFRVRQAGIKEVLQKRINNPQQELDL